MLNRGRAGSLQGICTSQKLTARKDGKRRRLWDGRRREISSISVTETHRPSKPRMRVQLSYAGPHGYCGGLRESFEVPKALVKRYIRPTARPVGSASTTGRRFTVAGSGLMVKANGCDRCTGAGLKSSVVNPLLASSSPIRGESMEGKIGSGNAVQRQ